MYMLARVAEEQVVTQEADIENIDLEDMTNKQLAALETQPDDVYRTTYLYWFFAGAAVLLAGFLTGYTAKRQRWKSSLS